MRIDRRILSQENILVVKNSDLEGFLEDLKLRNLAPHTIETYESNILMFLQKVGDPLKIDNSKLAEFLIYLRQGNYRKNGKIKNGHDVKTIQSIFSAVNAYYEYLWFIGKIKDNIIPAFRKRYIKLKEQYNGNNSRQLISIEEMSGLIQLAIKTEDILAKNIFLFLAKTGIRRGEFIAMDIEDINLEKMEFTVKPKAKRSNRKVFIDDEICRSLGEYLSWRQSRAKNNALWVSRYGRRLTRNFVYETITRYARIAALHNPEGSLDQKFTPHCCRHFFTTHMRRNGMPREFIQELRGDVRKDAIDIYDHIDLAELKESYLKHVPKLLKGEGVSCQIKAVEARE